MLNTLEELINLIRDRKKSSNENSYTNKLLDDKKLCVAKVKEEIGELIEADSLDTCDLHDLAPRVSIPVASRTLSNRMPPTVNGIA